MRWSHLPVAGGLYAQDPEFISIISYMFAKKAEADEREQKSEEQKSKSRSKRR